MHTLRKVWIRSSGLVRFAYQIREFLSEPLTAEQAADIVAKGVRRRDARFLGKLESVVYGNPTSPYRKLLESAGCERGDVEGLVRREGLEGTLEVLARAGVYLTFDEFKCRVPVVRGSLKFEMAPADLDDPTMRAESFGATGGTSGKPARVRWAFAQTAQSAPHWCVFFAANNCLGAPLLYWRPGHAGASGAHVAWAKFGRGMEAWFVSQEMTNSMDRLYAGALRWIGRSFAGFPRPRNIAYHDAEPWLEEVLRILSRSRSACLNTPPSAAARLSLAAQRRGVRLTGLTCLLGAEPLTVARRAAIEASGARATPLYGSQEATWTGGQCPHPRHADEVHVLGDLHAVIAGGPLDKPVSEDGAPLLFTSLAPVAPTFLLNTDIGDRGIIGSRRCDCLYDRLGCRQTIHDIRSSDKITGFGVTFWVADVCEVLDTALPSRLGATPGDFQLLESDSESPWPRYILLADPRLTNFTSEHLLRVFLEELSRRKSYYGFMTAIWKSESVIEVRRKRPVAAAQGKTPLFRRLSGPLKPGALS